jgi:glycosyltransferase involved in cell wall biosynthesis
MPHSIVFLGHVLEKQGLQVVVEALPAIHEIVPDVRLLVIGDGPYRPALEELASHLRVQESIEFVGFRDDHFAIEEWLLGCELGVAPYVPAPWNFSRFQDLPGKIINYLACGLAVVITDVPRLAHAVEDAGAGRVVEYSPAAIADAIIAYFVDPALLERTRTAALSFVESYDWVEVFDNAFDETDRALTARPDRQAT